MSFLTLQVGDQVVYQNQSFRIKAPISLNKIMLVDSVGQTIIAPIHQLQPDPVKLETVENQKAAIPANDLLSLSAAAWQELTTREQLLQKLLQDPSLKMVKEIAQELNITWRQVYNLAKKYKQSGGGLSGVIIKHGTGGKDKSRLLPEVEILVNDTIQELYCDRQKRKPSVIIEEINRRCYLAKFKAPAPGTIRTRISHLVQREIVLAREGNNAARAFNPIKGATPLAEYPLQEVQIDHTKVDLIIVDDLYRQLIGRPYLTVAIDVFSRCITGFCLTLEAPSATSVGLCLTHSVFKKDCWLSELGVEGVWPIWGKPGLIHVDNGGDFHSEALIRGCEFHGIKVKYRPPGAPHYGGIVERIIGTLMQLIHQIPGTTFSNIQERGDYNSEKQAVMTLKELEKWLAIAIVNYYHQKAHSSLLMAPIEKYRLGILGDGQHKGIGYPKLIVDQRAFLLDFLPIFRRILRRDGFELDRISYYSNILTPFIYDKKSTAKFVIRRDPRDLSIIYFLDPKSNCYFEVPYRHLARPTISLWEHKAAVKHLRDLGRRELNEELIFSAIFELRNLTKEAAIKSKQARRNQERINNNQLISAKEIKGSLEELELEEPRGPIKAFTVEIW